MASLLTAREAADRLGIKLDTLYAYVSRGLLQSIAVPGSRERRYRPEDLDAFGEARARSLAARRAAAETVMPVIDSAICLIENGRLYYRGRDAIGLSDRASLEDAAALLWGVPAAELGHAAASGQRQRAATRESGRQSPLIARCQMRLAGLGEDFSATEPRRAALAQAGWRIVQELVGCVIGASPPELPVHRQLAAHWGLDERGGDLLRRCLVLLADHEFNASTFVARCVASTGASLPAAVSAALGALSGPRHGGAAVRAEAAFHAAKATGDPIMAIVERLARGDDLPGIGHPLYPDGDPRAVAILYALSLTVPQARRPLGRRPNVDFALAAVTTTLGLPLGAALSLFVVGRSVGWIAHAIEQYESGVLIRPRARYIGIRPDDAGEPS